MKIFLAACTALLLISGQSRAQQINSTRFLTDLQTLIADAAKGFPKTTGDVTEDNRYGKDYAARISFFGLKDDAKLHYTYAQDNNYADDVAEEFRFAQFFPDSTAAGKWAADSAEVLLDGVAKSAGLKRVKPKLNKDYRKTFKIVQYTHNGKPAFKFAQHIKSGSVTLTIYSPYRPGDVAAPPNFLGCLVFSYSGMSKLMVAPVYGPAFDKDKMAPAAARRYDQASSDHKWRWFPGRTVKSLEAEFGKGATVQELEPYYVE